MLRYFIPFFTLLMFVSSNCRAQTFRVSDTLVVIEKSEIASFVYDYADIENLTDSVLNIRWLKHLDNDFPEGWQTSVQDPENWYPDHATDSADFMLDTLADNSDKLIAQFYPNGNIDTSGLTIELFDVKHPETRYTVRYEVRIKPLPTSTDRDPLFDLRIFPIPAGGDYLFFSQKLPSSARIRRLTDTEGHEISGKRMNIQANSFFVGDLKPGLYILCLQLNNSVHHFKFLKK